MLSSEEHLRRVIRATLLNEQVNQRVASPEFKRWFGRSMLVDPAGNPIKLYHGTRRSFNVFNLSEFGNYGPGIYLTASSANAAGFASGRHHDPNAAGGGSVMPLYARLVNPLIIVEAPSAAPQIRTINGELTPGHEALQEKLSTLNAAVEYMGGRGSKEFSREVRALGHDGIIVDFTGLMTDPADMVASGITKEELTMGEVIVFDPRQVKSALGNPGTYDPDDPNIVTERDK